MNHGKLISIIIATYNAGATLARCLNSIVPQKSEEVELLIIDAESKDETINIIKSFGENIDYFKSEKDKGIYDAWNKGIKAAKGTWVMFIGADDLLNEGAISTYLKHLNNGNLCAYDYISGHNIYVNKKGKILKILGKRWSWAEMQKTMSVAHVGSLHNRKLFEQVGLYDLQFKICADYELLLRKKENLKMYFVDSKIVTMESGGISFSFAAIKEIHRIRRYHSTLKPAANFLFFVRDTLAYFLFRLKKFV